MAADAAAAGDSRERSGGRIPGSGGLPAFTLSGPNTSALPVLIAVPHAGRTYPASLLDRMRHPASAPLRLEDRHVDRLAAAIARETGTSLLVAHAPRALIDLNRAPDDIDWEMFGRKGPRKGDHGAGDIGSDTPSGGDTSSGGQAPGRRARSGLGLIPRRLPGLGELWKRRHDEADLAARLAGVHGPYHVCLAAQLEVLRARWGAALLIDLHSMPPLVRNAGQPAAEFVLGDRFGASCHGSLIAGAFAHLAESGRLTAHNRPYAGGYVLERHAAPSRGIHALQIEIDRRSYLDSALAETGPGFGAMAALLSGLVRRLAAGVAMLAGDGAGPCRPGERWAEAAE